MSDTPYREASDRSSEAGMLRCPACGGPCNSDARACPHCSVELASVRCGHCYSLHFVGSRFCAHCGKELELEPLLDATDAPCPRCNKRLSARSGGAAGEPADTTYECVSCGGLFLDNQTLDRVVAEARAIGAAVHSVHGVQIPVPVSSGHALEPVRYVKCPMCAAAMNRVNFGRRSGVIVNVCKLHGTWFDAGELARAYDFAALGGIDEAERRERERVAEEIRARASGPVSFGTGAEPHLSFDVDGGGLLGVLREILR